jgi:hypothetical protein
MRPAKEIQIKSCQWCGISFGVLKDMPKHEKQYCSKTCKSAYHKSWRHSRVKNFIATPIELKCAECEALITLARKTRRKYCSTKCRSISGQKKLRERGYYKGRKQKSSKTLTNTQYQAKWRRDHPEQARAIQRKMTANLTPCIVRGLLLKQGAVNPTNDLIELKRIHLTLKRHGRTNKLTTNP